MKKLRSSYERGFIQGMIAGIYIMACVGLALWAAYLWSII